MSYRDCNEPVCTEADGGGLQQTIEPKEKDLGGFTVRRVLPAPAQRRVGPFIFFDHMGPAEFAPGDGINVRPHPHIGLSTLTYLFEGEIMHRDSLGYAQPIQPDAVNWMTAGRGIVHSERTSDALKATGYRLHGIQAWIALPDGDEEVEPAFEHYPAGTLPVLEESGLKMTLIAGSAYGKTSPVNTFSPLFYLHVEAEGGSAFHLPDEHAERALYVVDGEVAAGGATLAAGTMAIFEPGVDISVAATAPSRLMLLGGAPLGSDRTVWWNFSSSSRERIEQAKRDWQEGRFASVPGETEFIPLPD